MAIEANMPAWLGARADWEVKNTSDLIQELDPFVNVMQGMDEKLKQESVKTSLATGLLNQQAALLDIKSQQMQLHDTEIGMKEYPEWLRATGGDPQKMMDTPFTGTSQFAAQKVAVTQQAAWQRYTQQQAVEIKKQDVENKLAVAKMANDTKRAWIDMQGQVAELRANATKAGKGGEFETLLGDYQKNINDLTEMTKDPNADPTALANLQQTIALEKDRLNKLGKFAGEVPTTETDTTVKSPDGNLIVTKKSRGPGGQPASSAASTPKAMGGYKAGTIYKGGLKYLGGDPKDEASWEQTQ